MKNRLILGMYGDSRLFDLRTGQMRDGLGEEQRLIKNAGWYNADGHKLGWGDIGPQDIKSISSGLDDDEIFVVLTEHASFHKFVEQYDGLSGIGSLAKVDSTAEYLPSRAYVAGKAVLALMAGVMIDTGKYGTVGSFHNMNPGYYPDLEIKQQSSLELYLQMAALAP
jgi:hypothetical protein